MHVVPQHGLDVPVEKWPVRRDPAEHLREAPLGTSRVVGFLVATEVVLEPYLHNTHTVNSNVNNNKKNYKKSAFQEPTV